MHTCILCLSKCATHVALPDGNFIVKMMKIRTRQELNGLNVRQQEIVLQGGVRVRGDSQMD